MQLNLEHTNNGDLILTTEKGRRVIWCGEQQQARCLLLSKATNTWREVELFSALHIAVKWLAVQESRQAKQLT